MGEEDEVNNLYWKDVAFFVLWHEVGGISDQELAEAQHAFETADTIPAPPPEHGAPEGSEW